MRNDAELLRSYAGERSEEAFTELVRRHIGSVYAIALRRVWGDSHLAEDVTQEVFTDMARKAGPLSRRQVLVGWLFVAARFASAKAVRRDQKRRSLRKDAIQMNEPMGPSGSEPNWDNLRPVLDDAIHELNKRDREAVLLHFFDKQTYRDIGAKLSLSESGARMRVERALDKLRLSLGRRGISSSSAALAVALSGQAVAAVPSSLATTVTTAAIAGSAQSGGATLLYLMTITNTQLSAALAVVLTGAAILGVAQRREILALRLEVNTQLAESGRRTSELTNKLAADDAALANLNAQLSASKSARVTGAPSAAQNSPTTGVKVLHMKDIIRDHPEFAALEQKELRRSVLRLYGRAMAALSLPSEQSTKLKEMLVEKEMTMADAYQASADAGLQQGSSEMNKMINEATKDLDRAIASLLGNDGYDKLEALKGTGMVTYGGLRELDDVALDMADAGVAPTPEQTQVLAQTLHDIGNPSKNPDASVPGFRNIDPTTWLSPLDQQFFAQASSILTPTQLQILEASRSDDNHRMEIMKQLSPGNVPVMIMP